MFNPPSDPSTGDGGDLAAFVIAAVRGHTGKTITKLAAAQGIERTLAAAGGAVRDPRRYLAAAISRDPAAWLPGPSIPSYAERMAQLERLRESGDEDDH